MAQKHVQLEPPLFDTAKLPEQILDTILGRHRRSSDRELTGE